MAPYKVTVASSAEKELQGLDKTITGSNWVDMTNVEIAKVLQDIAL